MDIKRISDIMNVRPPDTKKVNQDTGFEKIMNQTLSEIKAKNPVQAVDPRTVALDHSSNVLNLLDQYAAQLGDNATTLKEIYPIVSHIEKEVDLMKASVTKDMTVPREINQFLEDVAVTANVAILKFHRGDFIQ